jgi:hypothetical protein
MKKPIALWIIAFVVTAASAVYQRMTGPTYPITEHRILNGKEISFRLVRSHGGETNCPFVFETGDPSLRASIAWKRFKTKDEWTIVPLQNVEGTLRGEIPHQPPAGKLEYRLTIQDARQTILLPANGPNIVRFKGDVPTPVIIIHVLVIFSAMLFSTRTAFELLRPVPRLSAYAWWTAGLLFAGGLILGPIVQKYAFDAYWTGWPFGTDLTDNKTAAAFLVWLAAAFMAPRSKNPGRWIVGAAIVTLAVFLIPHSMLGSELDYSKMDTPPRP